MTPKERRFYARHVPEIYWSILDPTFDKRTRVEQSFGHDQETYSLMKCPRLGFDLSHQFIGLVNCEALLTALTAIQTNQFHLVRRAGAFRRLGLAYQGLTLAQVHPLQEGSAIHSTTSPSLKRQIEPFTIPDMTLKNLNLK